MEKKALLLFCSKILAADSMKPNKLKDISKTLHALTDGVTRCALFNVWNEEQDPEREIDAVLSLVWSTTGFDKYENRSSN
ncbi:hypothetical protein TNCV_4640941 [Trichonephila clavipes]|nr:hypothetical protein TNCV_4640941 [Trichonephila clavipes]